MNGWFASSIFVGLLAIASCARVSSTSALDGGAGGGGPGDTGGTPVDRPGAMASLCGAGKSIGNAGCSFYGTETAFSHHLDGGRCYVMFVVNPGTQPARLTLQRAGATYSMDKVARLPRGAGPSLSLEPFDPTAGLAPGDGALVFLSGGSRAAGDQIVCPPGTEPAVRTRTSDELSNVGDAFHLTSDRPVVVYDINPYRGQTPSASLLLPEEAWGRTNLVPTPIHEAVTNVPFTNVNANNVTLIAGQDETEVTIKAPIAIAAGRGVPATPAGQTLRLKLSAGQYAKLTEQLPADKLGFSIGMSGTLISTNKAVAVVGASPCINLPADIPSCDSVHQQIPPFSAWGNQYAGVSYRSRLTTGDEPVPWMLVGAVDGTVLTYSPKPPTPYGAMPAGAPGMLKAGQVVQFWTADPFVVRSQDADHPFYLAGMMTTGVFLDDMRSLANKGGGDPEFVNVIATDQYLKEYTFMTDPTYPETNLVVVRKPGADGKFADVKLACAPAPISGWKDLGTLQFARVDLVTADFLPLIVGCNNGVNRMSSAEPFSLTVWGWAYVTSYAYPAGSGLGVINTVPDPVIIQ